MNNIAGANNTANGVFALFDNTPVTPTQLRGLGTLGDNTTDSFNIADGANALIGGFYNTADGAFALLSNTEGAGNTGSGYRALFSNQDGANNAAYGYIALLNNTASFNTAFGSQHARF